MPHQIIEYSANLDADFSIDELVAALHQSAVDIDALPIGGIRTRAVRRDHYRIADGHPDNAFISVTLRIAAGRSLEVRQHAGAQLFKTLSDFVEPIFNCRPLSLSYEVQEIETEVRWKRSNIREYLAQRAEQDT
ncbi:MAG: 5-carboxymethyl-2-hydroxymuconate Delta-isomerase [Gammaproteobacteria bacterium]|nr:5-carboxymethyl-2-hydroxymuconate Delta-isomerase [Gammaproteobacteria bacterium]